MRCFKGRFLDNSPAKLGMGQCHGGPVVEGVKWKPCKYLERCLGMTVGLLEDQVKRNDSRMVEDNRVVKGK